jgi:hypothetical protein
MSLPECPHGVKIIKWDLKNPPVPINMFTTVTNTDLFARTTLRLLGIAIQNPKRWVGFSTLELVVQLGKVGVTVELEKKKAKA